MDTVETKSAEPPTTIAPTHLLISRADADGKRALSMMYHDTVLAQVTLCTIDMEDIADTLNDMSFDYDEPAWAIAPNRAALPREAEAQVDRE